MRRPARIGLIAGAAALALAAGAYERLQSQFEHARNEVSSALTRADLPDLSGRPASLRMWQGKVIVVNFWASWCPPCRDEIPGLVNVQRKYAADGLQVVGIAVDSPEQSRQAAAETGISYPVLVGGPEAIELIRPLGNANGGLPYTLILDRKGSVVETHLGIITEPKLEELIRPYLG